MRGDFIGVWAETWNAIWLPLTQQEDTPAAAFCDLYREMSRALLVPPTIEQLADVIDSSEQSTQAFQQTQAMQFSGEKALVRFFEDAFDVLEDIDEQLATQYFQLLGEFIQKYNLGYALRAPCALSPTLPGMFADLASALGRLAEASPHLSELHKAHEESLRDLRYGATEERLKSCISRQFMLLEAVASQTDQVTANTLGGMCDQLTCWPHVTIREALKKLYGFASDYPGIRHAGNPESKLRSIDTRDLAAVSIVLMGYAQYLTSSLDTNFSSLLAE